MFSFAASTAAGVAATPSPNSFSPTTTPVMGSAIAAAIPIPSPCANPFAPPSFAPSAGAATSAAAPPATPTPTDFKSRHAPSPACLGLVLLPSPIAARSMFGPSSAASALTAVAPADLASSSDWTLRAYSSSDIGFASASFAISDMFSARLKPAGTESKSA